MRYKNNGAIEIMKSLVHRGLLCGLVTSLIGASIAGAAGGSVESIYFKASVTPPVFHIPEALQASEPMLRMGLGSVAEVNLVMGALKVGGGQLGLSENAEANLVSLLSVSYGRIAADPGFAKTPSALAYCFSATKQKLGHYFIARPAGAVSEPPCIVVLHGDGGNLQLYVWALKDAFPEAVVLAPSWSSTWNGGSPTYLRDMLTDARKRTGLKLSRPWLIGVSTGGDGGFSIYNNLSTEFAGYVSIAGVPSQAVAKQLGKSLNILMVNGTKDPFLPIASARKRIALAKSRVPGLVSKELDGGHFLLLEKRRKVVDLIRAFMSPKK